MTVDHRQYAIDTVQPGVCRLAIMIHSVISPERAGRPDFGDVRS
jgi:hypothetical protein